MITLTTVPTFTFNQGDPLKDDNFGRPITVKFYNGSIELSQEGDFNQPETISLSDEYFKSLFKEISKHYPEAKNYFAK